MNDLEVLSRYLSKKSKESKTWMIVSLGISWISLGIGTWLVTKSFLFLGLILVPGGIGMLTLYKLYSLRLVYSSLKVSEVSHLYNTLLYVKDGRLIELIRNRNLQSGKPEDIEAIVSLVKSISTIESKILIGEILRKEGFTDYIYKDERDIEEDID